MIRLGVLDFDTSHVVEFTRRLNHKEIDREQWVDGAEVVLGCPGKSRMAPERIPDVRKEAERLGLELVDRPEAMIGKVDGVLIESQEGSVHWERTRPFLEAGLTCFIDKPFACSVADARKLVDLSQKKKAPVFSSSSLRYAPELAGYLAEDKRGKVLGALAYGPARVHEPDPRRNPGLFHYGIHAVEVLYALMGPGCERVVCTHEKDVDVVTGRWHDGRVATVRGTRRGQADYGAVAFAEQGVRALTLGTKFVYRELLKQVVAFFREKKSPLDVAVTVEIVAFIEASARSAANHGAGEKVVT
jgi:hypothetical protein